MQTGLISRAATSWWKRGVAGRRESGAWPCDQSECEPLALSPDGLGTRGSFIATLDVLVVQCRHAPIATKSVTIADLAEQQWILNPQGCGYRAALQRAMEGVGKQVRLGIDMHGTGTQLRLVAAGLGRGLAPTRLLANSHSLKDLCPVEVADFALKPDSWLLRAAELRLGWAGRVDGTSGLPQRRGQA